MKFVEDLNKEGSWKEMDGDGDLEKKINHYLTKTFIWSTDVPADECLHEAQAILEMTGDGEELEQKICRYIIKQFSISVDFERYMPFAKEIVRILNR